MHKRLTDFKKFTFPVKILGLIILILALVSLTPYKNQYAFAAAGDCTDAQAQSIEGTADLVSYTAPSGNIVSGVCIKSGENMFTDGHSGQLGNGTYEDSCYTVSGVGTDSVTVTRNSEGSDCQGLSHIDVYYGTAPSPSPSPSPSVSPSASPTASPSASPSSSPSPSPSPSPSASPTPAPTNPPSGGTTTSTTTTTTTEVLGISTTATPTPAPSQEVLGISTTRELPNTGPDSAWLAYFFGTLLSGIALVVKNRR